jgi:hypothetical protein
MPPLAKDPRYWQATDIFKMSYWQKLPGACQYSLSPCNKFAGGSPLTSDTFATGLPLNIQRGNLSAIPLKEVQ